MNTTRKLICTLLAGATLGVAAPVFADSYRDRGYEHNRHSAQFRDYDRRGYREHERYVYRDYGRRPVVVVERPYVIQQPVYYSQPPMANYGMGAMIGAAIGGYIDNQQ
jgi:hypothetical protein